jgi:hypothetical protein
MFKLMLKVITFRNYPFTFSLGLIEAYQFILFDTLNRIVPLSCNVKHNINLT